MSERERGTGRWPIGLVLSLALLALAVTIVLATANPTLAQRSELANASGTLRIQPQTSTVGPGGSVTVEVWLEDVGDYYGVDFRLAFHPSVLSVPAGQVTPLWDLLDPTNHFVVKNEADNAAGSVRYAVANMNPAEPFSGSGRICSITFSGLQPGASALRLVYAKAATRDGGALYPVLVDALIGVGAEPLLHDVYLPLARRQ